MGTNSDKILPTLRYLGPKSFPLPQSLGLNEHFDSVAIMCSRLYQIKVLCCSKGLDSGLSIILGVLHMQFFLCQLLKFLIFFLHLIEANSNWTFQSKPWYFKISCSDGHESHSVSNRAAGHDTTNCRSNWGSKQETYCTSFLSTNFMQKHFSSEQHLCIRCIKMHKGEGGGWKKHWALLFLSDLC